jgi:hypothetical protein
MRTENCLGQKNLHAIYSYFFKSFSGKIPFQRAQTLGFTAKIDKAVKESISALLSWSNNLT